MIVHLEMIYPRFGFGRLREGVCMPEMVSSLPGDEDGDNFISEEAPCRVAAVSAAKPEPYNIYNTAS